MKINEIIFVWVNELENNMNKDMYNLTAKYFRLLLFPNMNDSWNLSTIYAPYCATATNVCNTRYTRFFFYKKHNYKKQRTIFLETLRNI